MEMNETQEVKEGPMEVATGLSYRLSGSYEEVLRRMASRLLRQEYNTEMEATQVPGRRYQRQNRKERSRDSSWAWVADRILLAGCSP